MKNTFRLIVLVLLLSACKNNDVKDQTEIESDLNTVLDMKSEIESRNKVFMELYNSKNAKDLASKVFSENAIIFPPNSPKVTGGTDVIAGFWQAVMDMGIAKADIQTDTAFAYGNVIVENGQVLLYDVNSNLLDNAKYVTVWQKEDNTWKLVQDIWNSNNPLQ